VAVIALYNCGKSYFQTPKPLKISRMFIYWAIKYYRELWKVEDRAWAERLKSVRAEATIRTVRSKFAEILSGNRRSCPKSWTYQPNQVMPHQK